jgi:hypothetical protein
LYELFHVLPKDRFLAIGYRPYFPVCDESVLDKLFPAFRIYERLAALACVPLYAAMVSRVFLESLGFSAKIAAR